jgi:hypothetical protein
MTATASHGPSGQDEDPARKAHELSEPSTGDPGQDELAGWRLVPSSGEDWLTEDDWEEWAAATAAEEEPPNPGEDPDPDDPDDPALPGDAGIETIEAECRRLAAEMAQTAAAAARVGTTAALAACAASAGRRGPGQPGSADRFPGTYSGPAGGFATGQPLDVAPGGSVLLAQAEYAAGADDRFAGSSDDELVGVICGLDRAEAAASSLKHAAVAELIRRRPAPGCRLHGPAQMPEAWHEFTESELSQALAETRWAADGMLSLACDLEVKLPGTRAAFRSGVLRRSKAEIIARATALLDPEEARAAEAMVLDRAGRLTPGGLRSAITRAVIDVAPEKARKRREKSEQDARVQRWMEDSGNAALMGRELPPADVLAADQRITWWAKRLRQAGLDGDMDQLRARAYLDLLLGKDSRPAAVQPHDPHDPHDPPGGAPGSEPGRGGADDSYHGDGPHDSTGSGGPDGSGNGGSGPGIPPTGGAVPAGFAGRLHLTIPLTTLLGLAERPGEIAGIGPVDPALARDLAGRAAASPRTTYCLTVTDDQGHAIGHGCARAERGPQTGTAKRSRPGPPGGHDPPGGPISQPAPISQPGPGFTFRASGEHGPPGGYGLWWLATGIPGARDLRIVLEPLATEECDHRFQARGHEPGVMLRHLSQIRHATCTGPTCRRPAQQCDFEHNIPYEAGGMTCLCNGGPKCRHEHRLKQDPRWKVEQITPATFRWTTPSGRQYTTEATRYPI